MSDIKAIAQNIKLLILDVDGVLTDGKVYFGESTEELKAYNIKDGLGMRLLMDNGIEIAIITGRNSKSVEIRMAGLGIKHLYQGKLAKRESYEQLIDKLKLSPDEVAYIGDDLIDLPVMTKVGLPIAVADAHTKSKEVAKIITTNTGGNGAVREICDLILEAQGKLEAIYSKFLND
ncbi:MAG: 3-deoxy-manno-octulosonate-8-phosphatase KdsC [Gammaproteobacteria bacterium]|nr:MAG: 3-deoxy-manno-octulosonate-8-phosphatase KdsC [Gammaproteobacteria bacterium]